MSQYRKKPVVIDAVQWMGNLDEMTEFVTVPWHTGPIRDEEVSMFIPTLEGEMEANPGDWIIKGVQGEFYPCKPEIFEATYEPA